MNKETFDVDVFKSTINTIKDDIKSTRFRIINNANTELLALYMRIGKIVYDNSKYGSYFINHLSMEIKIDFPNMKGFSPRNLARMRIFYVEYKDIQNLPPAVAKLPWTHNCILIDKIKDMEKRIWYANKCLENGWTKVVLIHQIESNLYFRQKEVKKLNNFNKKLSTIQSELANEMMKDPYIFELSNLKENAAEKDIENAMVERIKNVLLELGKGFSFVGNQYKISVGNEDYYIDLLFYDLDLRCYIVVELKSKKFKPEDMGQLNFYVTAIDKLLKKDNDMDTLGLILCKEKDWVTVEWSLENINSPIGVSTYKIKDVLSKLPTEEEINMHLKDL